VKWVHYRDVAMPSGNVQMAISRGSTPSFFAPASCSWSCTAQKTTTNSYCTIVIQPCNFTTGDYFIRLFGVAGSGSSLPNQEYDFSLYVEQVPQAAVALQLNQFVKSSVRTQEYRHYSIAIPAQRTSWLRAELYGNADQMPDLTLFLGYNGLAGLSPCFRNNVSCVISDSGKPDYCEFYINPCSFAFSSTYFLSVYSNTNNYNDIPYQFTIGVRAGAITTLDPVTGFPVTGLVRAFQSQYYQFTVTPQQMASNIFHLEVASIEPMPCMGAGCNQFAYLITTVSTNAPGSSVLTTNSNTNGDSCACSKLAFVNQFYTTDFECDFASQTATTYYVQVYGNRPGAVSPFDPVSFTIRAWFVPIIQASITPGAATAAIPPFTPVPRPLNFDQYITYTISGVQSSNTQYLTIEIADLIETNAGIGNNLNNVGINAWLGVNTYGSPSHTDSLFRYGTASPNCFSFSCSPVNTNVPNPNATVMCRFTLLPCYGGCNANYKLTIMPRMFEPELNPQRLVKFSVRAYYTNIGTLSQSPFSNNTANLRTLALAAGGLTYNFQNERNNRGFATIECEGRFGTTFYRDYVVSTGSTFAPATPYEQLVITGAGSQTVEFSTVRPGIGCGCNTGGSSCTFNCNSGAQNTFITIRDTSSRSGCWWPNIQLPERAKQPWFCYH